MREPTSMEECVYFTKRDSDKGKATAWVFREKCPKCGQALMGKPKDKKTGKVKTRADEYVCEACNYKEEKDEYESKLNVNIKYTCPNCKFEGETIIPLKRKKVQIFDEEEMKKKTVESLRFKCENCKEDIDIVKKMKA